VLPLDVKKDAQGEGQVGDRHCDEKGSDVHEALQKVVRGDRFVLYPDDYTPGAWTGTAKPLYWRILAKTMDDPDRAILKAKLNLDTSLISWHELQRHFAAGSVISVRTNLDLVEVALCISTDDSEKVGKWLSSGMIGKVSDEEARMWLDSEAELWAVVVKPWVLVQEPGAGSLQ